MVAVAALALLPVLALQVPVGAPLTAGTAEGSGPGLEARIATRLQDARDAAKNGDLDGALHHGLAALALGPARADSLATLCGLFQGDAEARFLWTLAWLRAAADGRGRFRLDRHQAALVAEADLELVSGLCEAEALACEELARFAGKRRNRGRRGIGDGLLLRWALDLLQEGFARMPAVQRRWTADLTADVAVQAADHEAVLAALERLLLRPGRPLQKGTKELDEAASLDLQVRAAACLRGLAAQARFEDLEGPEPPELDRRKADAALASLRRVVDERAGEPLTVDKLEAMTEEERDAISTAHAHWADPGVALSPGGLYRIETICGARTLLAAARTIELHHRRLAQWFGKDPFQGRPGLVRIVPESSELEAEGAPYWWAGGFQAGDLTVVRLAWGTEAGLGRTLTHELTHRFDGALHAGLPSWATEGRAVWTASSYGPVEDQGFVEDHLDIWHIQGPYIRGYGGADKLRQLIEGTIEDYRDNYTAGHALYSFLKLWEVDGRRVFAAKLAAYLKRAVLGRKQPFEWFLKHFADGKDGRPDGFDPFVAMWNDFLRGCYDRCWNKSVPWVERYRTARPGGRRNGLLLDEPTWTWARDRAEPWFGQGHAHEAARILVAVGQDEPALQALLWALQTDGWRLDVLSLATEVATRLGRDDLAWVLRFEAHRRFDRPMPQGPMPLLTTLPKLRALATRLAGAVAALEDRGMPLAARHVDAERARLDAAIGLPHAPPAPLAEPRALPFPLGGHATALSLLGLEEDGLTGAEERRVRDLWFETEEGDLHVGRAKPREDTGTIDNRAHIRDAFVRSVAWQRPGRYRFRTRVHLTTSYVEGGLVLGYTRRDRNLRLSYSAGDYLFSIGKKDEKVVTKQVRFGLRGLWEREGNFPGGRPWHRFEWEHPVSSFAVEVLVDGPSATVRVDGEPVFRYTTPDLSPIEGHIGAWMSNGAVRLQEPTVERLDEGLTDPPARPYDPLAPETRGLTELVGAPTTGLTLSENGALVLWIPTELDEGLPHVTALVDAARRMGGLLADRLRYPQPLTVIVPEAALLPVEEGVAPAPLALPPQLAGATRLEHKGPRTPLVDSPWLLFVDRHGVLREAVALKRKTRGVGGIERWARCYRGR
ncbi:MAG: hypothetical protein R3F30_01690 [Planctomycetota bacterium]